MPDKKEYISAILMDVFKAFETVSCWQRNLMPIDLVKENLN